MSAFDLVWVRAEDVDRDGAEKHLKGIAGLLVAPGFGERGIEGKIKAIEYVRTQQIPFLGICLGLQCAVIEFARHVCGLEQANSTEFRQTTQNVIDMMTEQKKVKEYGGLCVWARFPPLRGNKGLPRIQTDAIHERHRHRYKANDAFSAVLRRCLILSGTVPTTDSWR
jgi:CTP synthase